MREPLLKIMPSNKADELIAVSEYGTLKANDFFINAGEIPKKLAFVITGLFRYLYISDKGHEFTKGLFAENSFICSYSAMISHSPSYFSIQALENAEILKISFSEWEKLLKKDPFWLKFLLQFVEKGFVTKEKRERELLLLDSKTRYLNFLEEYPDMDKRVKQTIIASYLGIQPESLSRIKKSIALSNEFPH